MAFKMQQYDEPTDTWIDVVSVTQEVIGGGEGSLNFIAFPAPALKLLTTQKKLEPISKWTTG